MKRLFLTFCLAVTVLASNAKTFSGNIIMTRNGQTSNADVTMTMNSNGNGQSSFVLQVNPFGIVRINDVPAATAGNITVYSADRDAITDSGNMRATIFARVTDGMMVADINIPTQNTTIHFNSVGDHFQLPNSDMEAWNAGNGEPDRWHGFKSAGGGFANTSAGLVTLASSEDVRQGATGHSAVMKAGSIFGVVANGTMTNGQLMAGSMSASDTRNHAEMDKDKTNTDANGDLFYMPLYAKPDMFNVWLKYTQGTENIDNMANVSVKTFDGTYYQEPVDKEYTNLSGSIVGGQIPAGGWTFYSFPFDYDSYAGNNAATEAIFVTFSTNGNPGQGSKNDALYVDDIELVYLGAITDLRYQGVTIADWNPAVTEYTLEMTDVPSLNDFTATIVGASTVLTKTMEQNTDGSYRIAISVVSADLQTATCYIINVINPSTQVIVGDVDNNGVVGIADVTALIDYLLGGNVDINTQAADVDNDGSISISDVTTLIDMLLSGN